MDFKTLKRAIELSNSLMNHSIRLIGEENETMKFHLGLATIDTFGGTVFIEYDNINEKCTYMIELMKNGEVVAMFRPSHIKSIELLDDDGVKIAELDGVFE